MVRVNCDQCSQSFNTKKLFVSHLITKSCHKSIREAAKSQTRNKVQQEESFDYPTLEIVPIQDCSECRRFSKAGMQMYMLSHLASHVQSKAEYFQCADCSLKFESACYLEKHENKKHKNEKCEDCPKKFKTKSLLQQHLEDVHKTLKCRECDFRANTAECMEKHVFNSHPTDICEECGMAFENASAVEKHFQDIHEKMKCDDCEDEFDTEELLDNHKVEDHNVAKTTFKQFGGGLMMMMISEDQERADAEIADEKKDISEAIVAREVQEIVKEYEVLDVDPENKNEEKDLAKAVVAREAQEIIKEMECTSEDEVLDVDSENKEAIGQNKKNQKSAGFVNSEAKVKIEGEKNNSSTLNKGINRFGSGFFMISKDESENIIEKKSSDESSKKSLNDSFVNGSGKVCQAKEKKDEEDAYKSENELSGINEAFDDVLEALKETKEINSVNDSQNSNSDLMDITE